MFGKGQKSFDEISTTVACENFPGHQVLRVEMPSSCCLLHVGFSRVCPICVWSALTSMALLCFAVFPFYGLNISGLFDY